MVPDILRTTLDQLADALSDMIFYLITGYQIVVDTLKTFGL